MITGNVLNNEVTKSASNVLKKMINGIYIK